MLYFYVFLRELEGQECEFLACSMRRLGVSLLLPHLILVTHNVEPTQLRCFSVVLSRIINYFLLLSPVTYMRPVRRVRQVAAAIRIISQRRRRRTSRPPVNHCLAKVTAPRQALVVPMKDTACLKSGNALENNKKIQQFAPSAAVKGGSRDDGSRTSCIPKQMADPLVFRVVDRRVLGVVSQPTLDTIAQFETDSIKVMSRALVPRGFGRLSLQNEHKETAQQHSASGKALPRVWPDWNTSYTTVRNTSCYVEDVSEDMLENDGYYDDYDDDYDEYEPLWSPSAVRSSNRLEHVLYRLGMLEKLGYMFQTSECCDSYYESDEYSEDDSEDYSGQYMPQGHSPFNSFLGDDFLYSNVHMGAYRDNANGFEGIGEDFVCNTTSSDGFSSGFSESPFAGSNILEQVLHRVRKVQDFAYMFPSQCNTESESEYDEDITSEEDILLEYSEDEELQTSSDDYSDSLSLEEHVDTYKTYVSEHYDYVDMQCSPQKGLQETLGNGTGASTKAIPTAQSPTKPVITKSNCAHHRVDSLIRSESLDSAESIGPRPESVGVTTKSNEMSILAGLPCSTASGPKNRTAVVEKIPIIDETDVFVLSIDDQARDTTRKAKRPAPKQRVYTWEEKGKAIADEAVESFELTDDEKAILAYIHKKDAERYPDGPPCCSKDVPHLKKKVQSKTQAGGQDDFPDYEFIPTGFNKFGSIEGDLILSGGMDMEEQKRRWDELTTSLKEPPEHNSKPKEEFDMELEEILSIEEIEDQKRMYEEISRAHTRKTTNTGLTQEYHPIR